MTYEAWRISYQSSEQAARAAYAECARLQANIAEREKQVPVAFGLYSGWALKATYLKDHEACEQRDRRQLTADLSGSLEAYRVVPLYALPGAQTQPAPGIPEGWKLVPIEPTEKMINEGTCASTLPGPRYIDSACAKQCWTNMLAAAPEANQ